MCERIFCSKCCIMKMMSHEKVIQKIRICLECDRLHVDFAKDLKDKKVIMKVDEDFLMEVSNNESMIAGPSKLVQARKES